MHNFLRRLLDVRTTDADDARRRKLLNILLVGLGFFNLLALIVFTGLLIGGASANEGDFKVMYGAIVIMMASIAIIYLVNHYRSGSLASTLFLLMLTIVLAGSDTPAEVANGRSLFTFTLPIVMASVLLRPYASFIFAILSDLIVAALALSAGIVPNAPAILGFLLLAVVSWISARSLEQALRELREINRDLDRRVAERTQELSESLARERVEASRNHAILEGIADGVIMFDPQGRAIKTNPAIGQLLDRPAEEMVGQSVEALVNNPSINAADQEQLVKLVKRQELQGSNIRVRWGDKTFSINSGVVADDGHISGKVAVFRDFTREAEIDKMKSTIVAMVSHELRTPLNAVLGYTEMLRDGVYGSLTEKQGNAIARVMKNTNRLLEIVNDLLDQAQIESGELRLRYGQFTATELLDNLHALIDKTAQDKGIGFNTSIDKDLPLQLTGDVQRLEQVLVNLSNNAVKFTDKGRVDVRLYRAGPAKWAIDVHDTGPGISRDAQTYIFDAFRQIDTRATRQHRGIGLGLSIVRRLVNLMDGEISVNSEVGLGSTFTVVMPLEPKQKEKCA